MTSSSNSWKSTPLPSGEVGGIIAVDVGAEAGTLYGWDDKIGAWAKGDSYAKPGSHFVRWRWVQRGSPPEFGLPDDEPVVASRNEFGLPVLGERSTPRQPVDPAVEVAERAAAILGQDFPDAGSAAGDLARALDVVEELRAELARITTPPALPARAHALGAWLASAMTRIAVYRHVVAQQDRAALEVPFSSISRDGRRIIVEFPDGPSLAFEVKPIFPAVKLG